MGSGISQEAEHLGECLVCGNDGRDSREQQYSERGGTMSIDAQLQRLARGDFHQAAFTVGTPQPNNGCPLLAEDQESAPAAKVRMRWWESRGPDGSPKVVSINNTVAEFSFTSTQRAPRRDGSESGGGGALLASIPITPRTRVEAKLRGEENRRRFSQSDFTPVTGEPPEGPGRPPSPSTTNSGAAPAGVGPRRIAMQYDLHLSTIAVPRVNECRIFVSLSALTVLNTAGDDATHTRGCPASVREQRRQADQKSAQGGRGGYDEVSAEAEAGRRCE